MASPKACGGRPRIFSTSLVTNAGLDTVASSSAIYAAEHIANDVDELGVGQGLRTGQRNLASQQVVAQQCVHRHRRDVGVDDGRRRGRRIRPTDHIAGSDLRCPHADEIAGEHGRPQAHPLQTRIDRVLLDFPIAVAAEA